MTCPFCTPVYDASRGVMSKCHLCAHRLDAGREPACVAACPTGALQAVKDQAPSATTAQRAVPGFVDPAGCGPSLFFKPPAGTRRQDLFRALEERLRR
jgi:Fe-S-cluster-containing dehydrogenase component